MADLLTRDQILEAQDIDTLDVEVPEWGGAVRIRGLTGTERDQFEASLIRQGPGGRVVQMSLDNARARLVAMCAIDAQGQNLFTLQDVAALGAKSAAALERVFDAARALSRLSDQDIKDLAKN